MIESADFGELEFQIRPGYSNLGAGAAMLASGTFLFFVSNDAGHRVLGACFALSSPFFLVNAALNWFSSLKCFETGVEFSGRYIAFSDLTIVQARIYSVSSHGVTTRFTKFRLEGRDADGPISIRMHIKDIVGKSSNGKNLIERASASIVKRMFERVNETGAAQWGNFATMARTSMILHKTGQEIAYRDVVSLKLTESIFPE